MVPAGSNHNIEYAYPHEYVCVALRMRRVRLLVASPLARCHTPRLYTLMRRSRGRAIARTDAWSRLRVYCKLLTVHAMVLADGAPPCVEQCQRRTLRRPKRSAPPKREMEQPETGTSKAALGRSFLLFC